ncbi:MAG: NADH-quinone oxidoreductase subunit N [Bacteroidota bacterium]
MNSRELDHYMERIGEYYMLITGMMIGMFLMVGSTNLLIMYLGFELTSLSSYVLVGFTKESKRSAEASMKYIIYGAVSSGVMLYGLSLLFGATGTVNIHEINEVLLAGTIQPMILNVSILMITVGLGFKIAVVPFHFWAPDVYEGAPITIAAFLAVASKIAAFGLLIRFFKVSFMDSSGISETGTWNVIEGINWPIMLAVLSALAMVVGNLTALRQDNIKRLLAYSSIAHAGYILMGLVILSEEGITSMMIYLLIYLFMNLGAFYVVLLVSNQVGTESIREYKGLGRRAPFLAVAMTIFLIALTGFPPTAGFIAKLYIFGATVHAGLYWLVFIAGLTTIVSLFYYVRIVRNIYFHAPAEGAERLTLSTGTYVTLLLLLIPVLLFGIYFTPLIEFARNSIVMFGG